MSTSLNGFRYIGDVEPAQGYAGYQWFNTTTGVINEWTGTNVFDNAGAGTWQNIYVNNLDNGGLLPVQGGSVTGAITGPAGWASSDNYNFPTSLKVSGQNVATVAYVNQQVTSFNDLISAKISQAISSATSSINTNANVAKYGAGTLGNGYFEPTSAVSLDAAPDAFAPIPLPKYPDGGLAAESECVWIGAPGSMTVGFTTENGTNDFNYSATARMYFQQTGNRIYQGYWLNTYTAEGPDERSLPYVAMGMNWLIFGIKASS
jgi:hypothetical protein